MKGWAYGTKVEFRPKSYKIRKERKNLECRIDGYEIVFKKTSSENIRKKLIWLKTEYRYKYKKEYNGK